MTDERGYKDLAMSWTDALTSDKLKNLAVSAISDSRINYLEMIDILSAASIGGMTPTKISDLKSIYLNSQTFFETDYLRTISYNVIFSNIANETWWGGAKNLSQSLPLGDLSASTTEASTKLLIGKWFLGTDLPMPVSGGDTATGIASEATYNYKSFTGSLFVNGIAAADVNQGFLGDCFLLASLGSIAYVNPNAITEMFTINPNGTYGVRFFNNGLNIYTTVDTQFTTTAAGSRAFARAPSDASNELWVGLAEKAYAQINMQMDVNLAGKSWTGENSFQSIEGGFAQPIKQILNLNYDYYSSFYQGIPDSYKSNVYHSPNAVSYKQTLINNLQAGAVGWLGTWGDTTGSNGKQNFVAGHAFMLLGYNSTTDKFIIRNPWGGDGTGNYNPQFEASIETFWNSNVKGLVALSTGTSESPNYNYTLENNANSIANAVQEGKAISFLISRNASGSSSTIYFSTIDQTATEGDYQPISMQAINFAPNETVKLVTVQTNHDAISEGTENLQGALYLNTAQKTSLATSQAYIANANTNDFNYTVTTPNSSALNAASEGQYAIFTVTRSGMGSSSTVYYSTRSGTATQDDYITATKQALTFANFETSKTISIALQLDDKSEASELFYVDIFKNIIDTTPLSSTISYIKDIVSDPYDYTIISNSDTEQKAILEGGHVQFTIVRSGTGSESTIYISTEGLTASTADYAPLDRIPLTFSANQTIATLEIATKQDWWLETPEAFHIKAFRSPTSSLTLATGTAYIKDGNVDPFNYTIASSASLANNGVEEGNEAVITITRSGTGSASTVYVSTISGTAEEGTDFQGLSKTAIDFAAFETQKTLTIKTLTDAISENTEHFLVNLYRNASDTIYSTFTNIYISNKAIINNYHYTLSNNSEDAENAIREGKSITITITRDGSGTASTVYLDTHTGNETAEGDIDYASLSRQAVTFAAFETSKTFLIQTYNDGIKDGGEGFYCLLYKHENDAFEDYEDYTYAYIADSISQKDYFYTISSSASQVTVPGSEGTLVTLAITRNGSGTASEVFISTESGTAQKNVDFQNITRQSLQFSDFETTKYVTVQVYQDEKIEGNEFFLSNLYLNIHDKDAHSSVYSYIDDAAYFPEVYYSISNNALTPDEAITEGTPITVTVTRSRADFVSTVYLDTHTNNETAKGGSDYAPLTRQAVTFAENELTKTVTIATYQDALTEDIEGFYCLIYTGFSDAFSNYKDYTYAYIKDPVGSHNFEYDISNNASTPSTAVTEGQSIIITITRNGTGAASTIYLDTDTGNETAKGDVDYNSLTRQAVTFAPNETTKTIEISTFSDQLKEDTEGFYCLLYKNYDDPFENYDTYTYAHIADNSIVNSYNYTLTNNAQNIEYPVTEGDDIIFYVTRNGTGSTSTIYLDTNTLNETALGGVDYSKLTRHAVTFEAHETIKTVHLQTYTDDIIEDVEGFYGILFENYDDPFADYAAYSYAYIQDPFYNLSLRHSMTQNQGEYISGNDDQQRGAAAGLNQDTLLSTPLLQQTDETVSEAITPFGKSAQSSPQKLIFPSHVEGQYGNLGAFAAILLNGSVTAWGNPATGGDHSPVTDALNGKIAAKTIFSNHYAFAALREDGSVIAWGDTERGGLIPDAIKIQLDGTIDVVQVFSTPSAFAALRSDGSVVTWGDANYGGDSSGVTPHLNGAADISSITSNQGAFAALRANGTVITWGYDNFGGNAGTLTASLRSDGNIKSIIPTSSAFAAIRSDGSVVAWGSPGSGGDIGPVLPSLNGSIDVVEIFATSSAFAALRSDGSIVTWGDPNLGGDSSPAVSDLKDRGGVVSLVSNAGAFTALCSDGTLLSWGLSDFGGNMMSIIDEFSGTNKAVAIAATKTAFAALREDGSVVTWGAAGSGGDSSAVSAQINGSLDVVRLYANDNAFAALRSDGSVVTWGNQFSGGNSSTVKAELDGTIDVVDILTNATSFSATRVDGTLISWGDPSSSMIGGNVGSVLPSVALGASISSDASLTLNALGSHAKDLIDGTSANDRFLGLGDHDTFDGGDGFDASLYSGRVADYVITKTNTGFLVQDQRNGSPDGIDTLRSVEKLSFADARIYDASANLFNITYKDGSLDLYNKSQKLFDEIDFTADRLYFSDQSIDMSLFEKTASLSSTSVKTLVELYIASFNRAPDAMGLNYWGSRLADGMSLDSIAKSFFVQPETVAAYPSSQSVNIFIDRVYNNVLSRSPDGSGMAYWKEAIESGRISKDVFLLAIINGAKAETGSAADKQTLINKTAVGMDYAFQEGLSNVTWAKDVMASVNTTPSSVQAAYQKTDGYAVLAEAPNTAEVAIKLLGAWDNTL